MEAVLLGYDVHRRGDRLCMLGRCPGSFDGAGWRVGSLEYWKQTCAQENWIHDGVAEYVGDQVLNTTWRDGKF